jgi:hypothetical protein
VRHYSLLVMNEHVNTLAVFWFKFSSRNKWKTMMLRILTRSVSTSTFITPCISNTECYIRTYNERQKYGINSLKIKQNFFQKNLWTGQF